MKSLTALLLLGAMMLISSSAFALIVGINPNIHNGTGTDAYDFHLEGIIKSTTLPQQADEFVVEISSIPGFDWSYDGGAITHIAGDLWHYSGGWSGNVPVASCEWIHIGKYFDVTCRNVFVGLRGWWTDREGEKINPDAGNPGTIDGTWVSDVPLVGFWVEDRILDGNANGNHLPQTLMFENATTQGINMMNCEVAISPEVISLAHLTESDPILARLKFKPLFEHLTLEPGQTETFNLNEITVTIPPGGFMVMRGYAQDWVTNQYAFFAFGHEAHIPEPGILALTGLGLLALLRVRHRRRRPASGNAEADAGR